jgi:hypothetical protein
MAPAVLGIQIINIVEKPRSTVPPTITLPQSRPPLGSFGSGPRRSAYICQSLLHTKVTGSPPIVDARSAITTGLLTNSQSMDICSHPFRPICSPLRSYGVEDATRTRGEKRPADVIGAAVMVARICVGMIEDTPDPETSASAAATQGRLGGKARARNFSTQCFTTSFASIRRRGSRQRWQRV